MDHCRKSQSWHQKSGEAGHMAFATRKKSEIISSLSPFHIRVLDYTMVLPIPRVHPLTSTNSILIMPHRHAQRFVLVIVNSAKLTVMINHHSPLSLKSKEDSNKLWDSLPLDDQWYNTLNSYSWFSICLLLTIIFVTVSTFILVKCGQLTDSCSFWHITDHFVISLCFLSSPCRGKFF